MQRLWIDVGTVRPDNRVHLRVDAHLIEDIHADSYQAASSVGGGDGRKSFGTYSETGDFGVQFEAGPEVQASGYRHEALSGGWALPAGFEPASSG